MEKDYRDRVVELIQIKASKLINSEHNPSVHSDQQKIIMEELLENNGFAGTIKARRVGKKIQILDGHLRAQLAGDSVVPVLILDLNEEEADIFMLTFDPVAAMAKISKSKTSALRTKAVTLSNATYEQIAEKVSIKDVQVNAAKEKIRENIRAVNSRISIGSVNVPVTTEEMANFVLLIDEYGEANGSFIGFGAHLLHAMGEKL